MARPIEVMKFGGTSVGDPAAIRRAAELVAEAARQSAVVAVVSAMSGVTNALVAAAHRAERGEEAAAAELAEWLTRIHATAIEALIGDEGRRGKLLAETRGLIAEAERLCRGAALLKELTPRAMDLISGIGERISARIIAATLEEAGVAGVPVEATELIVTDNAHTQAQPLMDQTRQKARARLLPLLEQGTSPVVTGFIGATADGVPTTLGRGGSDFIATILGACLDADKVIIWTDVDGVLTADPRLVADAAFLSTVSYNEAAELAHFGAKVLHPKTLRPVAPRGIPVWIRNSFAPEKPGTRIGAADASIPRGVRAITAIRDVSLVNIGGPGIVGIPDLAAKTFSATASVGANLLLITQSSAQNDICFVVQSGDTARAVAALRKALAYDLRHHDVEHITVNPGIAIVAVVGEQMRGTVGVAGRVFSILAGAGVNLIAIAQGSSENNISFVIEEAAVQKTVTAIHRELDLARLGPAGVEPRTQAKA